MPKPRPQTAKKSGFKVGPRTAKNVYSGHQDKIKATLIYKAKVKKSYAKDLKAEGYGTGTNGGDLGTRGSGSNSKQGSSPRGNDDVEMGSDEEEDREGEEEEEGNRSASTLSKGKAKASTSLALSTPILPVKKPRLSSPEIAAIREKKSAERKEWGQRGARGQPKLGGRVEMLLNRIKKSMA